MIDKHVIDRCVTVTESTSPSSLLTASLDAARRYAVTRGEELLEETLAALEEARARVREIPGLDVLDERLTDQTGVHGWDPLRFAVDVRGTGTTGLRIAELMRELDDINLELASENVVVAVFGLGEHAAPGAELLVRALRRAVEALGETEHEPTRPFAPPPPWGPLEMQPREAFLAPQDVVPIAEAAERIAAESLAAYPPGIPNVLPGERLTGETLTYIRATIAHGGLVRGATDRTLRTIRVVRG